MRHSVHAATLGRRAFLLGAGAVAISACSDDASPEATAPSATPTTAPESIPSTTPAMVAGDDFVPLTPAQFSDLPICAVLPSAAAGPFPTIDQLDRRDVTEGYPGHPLRLGLRVVDRDCTPVPGADVEIWHADATGDYSSFDDGGSGKDEGLGTTFLRGFQTADEDGILEFRTIYPGWYGGRAVHIHVRVHVGGTTVLTSQLYFDETYTLDVLATGEYAQFGPPDTTWATDPLAGDPATDGTSIALTSVGTGTLGLVNLGIPA